MHGLSNPADDTTNVRDVEPEFANELGAGGVARVDETVVVALKKVVTILNFVDAV